MSRPSTKAEQLEKEKKTLLTKDFVKNNPIFTVDHIMDFHELFNLYADPRNKRIDVRDVLTTARTLGLDKRYTLIFKVLEDLHTQYSEDEIDFETFIRELTERMGSPFDQEARRALWSILDMEGKDFLTFDDIKLISRELRFNLSDQDIRDVIANVGGYESDTIPYEKYEKYLARKIQRRQIEADLLKQ